MQVSRQHAGGISPNAKIGCVSQSDHAGIAENEVEREGKHHGNQHLGAKRHVVGKDKERANRQQPGEEFPQTHAVTPLQVKVEIVAHQLLPLPYKPPGRMSKMATVTA
jgi:hypothetical protein